MSIIKGLFFDLDGTLVDTLQAHVQSYKSAAREVGYTLTDKQLASVFGMRSDIFLKKLLVDIPEEDIKKIQKIKADSYHTFDKLIKPNSSLVNLLETLGRHHITILVTTASRNNVDVVLRAAEIKEELFDYIITGDQVSDPKPHPEAYIKALELSGLSADEVLAFEDSPRGVDSAQAAHISTLLIDISKGVV